MTTITARALWESARPLVDRADELGIPIASIHVSRWGRVELYVRDEDRRDDVDRLSAGPAQYFGSMYSRANAFGNSGVTLPDGVRVTVDSPHTLGVETSGGSCHVTLNDLRILRAIVTTATRGLVTLQTVRGGVVFTRDLLAALDKIAARELTVVAVSA